MTLLVGAFHFQPKALWKMDIDELHFWLDRADEWAKWMKQNG